MRKTELDKRRHLVIGKPAIIRPKPIEPSRRGPHVVEHEKEEYDVAYNDFFEFQKDLDEIEASNELIRRAFVYGESDEKDDPEIIEASFVVMEEEDEEEVIKRSPIIMEDYEEIPVEPVFKRCLYVKTNGERCKRQSPKNADLCASHRKK